MAITRPTVLPTWADTGDKTQPTNLEIETGWPVTSIPPSRQRFNWFFFWVANAVRYFSRRGLSDWVLDETYEIGDRCQSLVDGKTYRSKVALNVNFEPSVSSTQWERWGFSLSELWEYIAAGLNGGACPNTGPATAPTVANPYTQYTSALGEKWQWTAGAWGVVAARYGAAASNFTTFTLTAGVYVTIPSISFTMPRAGKIAVSNYCHILSAGNVLNLNLQTNLNGAAFMNEEKKGPFSSGTGASATNSFQYLTVSAGDVLSVSIRSVNDISTFLDASLSYAYVI